MPSNDPQATTLTCPKCHGQGEIEAKAERYRCSWCSGTGAVEPCERCTNDPELEPQPDGHDGRCS
jgi:RecJ-like exonuclease